MDNAIFYNFLKSLTKENRSRILGKLGRTKNFARTLRQIQQQSFVVLDQLTQAELKKYLRTSEESSKNKSVLEDMKVSISRSKIDVSSFNKNKIGENSSLKDQKPKFAKDCSTKKDTKQKKLNDDRKKLKIIDLFGEESFEITAGTAEKIVKHKKEHDPKTSSKTQKRSILEQKHKNSEETKKRKSDSQDTDGDRKIKSKSEEKISKNRDKSQSKTKDRCSSDKTQSENKTPRIINQTAKSSEHTRLNKKNKSESSKNGKRSRSNSENGETPTSNIVKQIKNTNFDPLVNKNRKSQRKSFGGENLGDKTERIVENLENANRVSLSPFSAEHKTSQTSDKKEKSSEDTGSNQKGKSESNRNEKRCLSGSESGETLSSTIKRNKNANFDPLVSKDGKLLGRARRKSFGGENLSQLRDETPERIVESLENVKRILLSPSNKKNKSGENTKLSEKGKSEPNKKGKRSRSSSICRNPEKDNDPVPDKTPTNNTIKQRKTLNTDPLASKNKRPFGRSRRKSFGGENLSHLRDETPERVVESLENAKRILLSPSNKKDNSSENTRLSKKGKSEPNKNGERSRSSSICRNPEKDNDLVPDKTPTNNTIKQRKTINTDPLASKNRKLFGRARRKSFGGENLPHLRDETPERIVQSLENVKRILLSPSKKKNKSGENTKLSEKGKSEPNKKRKRSRSSSICRNPEKDNDPVPDKTPTNNTIKQRKTLNTDPLASKNRKPFGRARRKSFGGENLSHLRDETPERIVESLENTKRILLSPLNKKDKSDENTKLSEKCKSEPNKNGKRSRSSSICRNPEKDNDPVPDKTPTNNTIKQRKTINTDPLANRNRRRVERSRRISFSGENLSQLRDKSPERIVENLDNAKKQILFSSLAKYIIPKKRKSDLPESPLRSILMKEQTVGCSTSKRQRIAERQKRSTPTRRSRSLSLVGPVSNEKIDFLTPLSAGIDVSRGFSKPDYSEVQTDEKIDFVTPLSANDVTCGFSKPDYMSYDSVIVIPEEEKQANKILIRRRSVQDIEETCKTIITRRHSYNFEDLSLKEDSPDEEIRKISQRRETVQEETQSSLTKSSEETNSTAIDLQNIDIDKLFPSINNEDTITVEISSDEYSTDAQDCRYNRVSTDSAIAVEDLFKEDEEIKNKPVNGSTNDIMISSMEDAVQSIKSYFISLLYIYEQYYTMILQFDGQKSLGIDPDISYKMRYFNRRYESDITKMYKRLISIKVNYFALVSFFNKLIKVLEEEFQAKISEIVILCFVKQVISVLTEKFTSPSDSLVLFNLITSYNSDHYLITSIKCKAKDATTIDKKRNTIFYELSNYSVGSPITNELESFEAPKPAEATSKPELSLPIISISEKDSPKPNSCNKKRGRPSKKERRSDSGFENGLNLESIDKTKSFLQTSAKQNTAIRETKSNSSKQKTCKDTKIKKKSNKSQIPDLSIGGQTSTNVENPPTDVLTFKPGPNLKTYHRNPDTKKTQELNTCPIEKPVSSAKSVTAKTYFPELSHASSDRSQNNITSKNSSQANPKTTSYFNITIDLPQITDTSPNISSCNNISSTNNVGSSSPSNGTTKNSLLQSSSSTGNNSSSIQSNLEARICSPVSQNQSAQEVASREDVSVMLHTSKSQVEPPKLVSKNQFVPVNFPQNEGSQNISQNRTAIIHNEFVYDSTGPHNLSSNYAQSRVQPSQNTDPRSVQTVPYTMGQNWIYPQMTSQCQPFVRNYSVHYQPTPQMAPRLPLYQGQMAHNYTFDNNVQYYNNPNLISQQLTQNRQNLTPLRFVPPNKNPSRAPNMVQNKEQFDAYNRQRMAQFALHNKNLMAQNLRQNISQPGSQNREMSQNIIPELNGELLTKNKKHLDAYIEQRLAQNTPPNKDHMVQTGSLQNMNPNVHTRQNMAQNTPHNKDLMARNKHQIMAQPGSQHRELLPQNVNPEVQTGHTLVSNATHNKVRQIVAQPGFQNGELLLQNMNHVVQTGQHLVRNKNLMAQNVRQNTTQPKFQNRELLTQNNTEVQSRQHLVQNKDLMAQNVPQIITQPGFQNRELLTGNMNPEVQSGLPRVKNAPCNKDLMAQNITQPGFQNRELLTHNMNPEVQSGQHLTKNAPCNRDLTAQSVCQNMAQPGSQNMDIGNMNPEVQIGHTLAQNAPHKKEHLAQNEQQNTIQRIAQTLAQIGPQNRETAPQNLDHELQNGELGTSRISTGIPRSAMEECIRLELKKLESLILPLKDPSQPQSKRPKPAKRINKPRASSSSQDDNLQQRGPDSSVTSSSNQLEPENSPVEHAQPLVVPPQAAQDYSRNRSRDSGFASPQIWCQVCSEPAFDMCSGCRNIYYCSEQCQRLAWPEHQKSCSPNI